MDFAPHGNPPSATLADRTAGNNLTRVTVNLTPRAVDALDRLCFATSYSKTDVVNRAIQLYGIINELMEAGSLVVRQADGGESIVHII